MEYTPTAEKLASYGFHPVQVTPRNGVLQIWDNTSKGYRILLAKGSDTIFYAEILASGEANEFGSMNRPTGDGGLEQQLRALHWL